MKSLLLRVLVTFNENMRQCVSGAEQLGYNAAQACKASVHAQAKLWPKRPRLQAILVGSACGLGTTSFGPIWDKAIMEEDAGQLVLPNLRKFRKGTGDS